MKNNEKGENAKKILTIKEILDENIRIETITNKETLKNVIREIIDATSYSKVKREDIMEVMEEIYKEYDMK